jgi:Adenylate and Guanylate cyclase catalytic domain
MRDLPAGTVTFLFTDIEGSTRLLHELGAERYAEALAAHRRTLRRAFSAHGGVEIDTQGDAFFVAFAEARAGVAAAREAQEELAAEPIRVRIGLHTGEPLLTDEGYVGADVHKAARICSAGHGGQIVVSEQTRLAVADGDLRALGLHRLKDLTAPEPLYQVGAGEFPPLKSLNQSNLPEQPTPFVGRERELAEVLQLLVRGDVRLLTLTGPGGSGKTRLAVQAAAEVVDEHEHGVWWIGLQAMRDSELVLPAIGTTIGASGDLAEYVGNRTTLLLLDNLEQVIEAAPELGGLLRSCPNLTLLVTSREPLLLAGEQEYPVPPFVEEEAVGFFLARARAARPGFSDYEAVREICGRLDHLPLPAGRETRRSGSGRCGRRSRGATTFSRRASKSCSGGSRSSPAAARWRPRRRSAPPSWTCSSGSSTRACSASTTSATRCSRRSASTRPSNSSSPARPTACAAAKCRLLPRGGGVGQHVRRGRLRAPPASARASREPRATTPRPTSTKTISSPPSTHLPLEAVEKAAKPIAAISVAAAAVVPSAADAVLRSGLRRSASTSAVRAMNTTPMIAQGHSAGGCARQITPSRSRRCPSSTRGIDQLRRLAPGGSPLRRASCHTIVCPGVRNIHPPAAARVPFSRPAPAAVGDVDETSTPAGWMRSIGSPR